MFARAARRELIVQNEDLYSEANLIRGLPHLRCCEHGSL